MDYYKDLEAELKYKSFWKKDETGKTIKPGDLLIPKLLYDKAKKRDYCIDVFSSLLLYEDLTFSLPKICFNVDPIDIGSIGSKLALSNSLIPLLSATASQIFTVAEYFSVKAEENIFLSKHFSNPLYKTERPTYSRLQQMLDGGDLIGARDFDWLDCKELEDSNLENISLCVKKNILSKMHKWLLQETDGSVKLKLVEFEKLVLENLAGILGAKLEDFTKARSSWRILFKKTNFWRSLMKIQRGVLQRYNAAKTAGKFFVFHVLEEGTEVDKSIIITYSNNALASMSFGLNNPLLQGTSNNSFVKNGNLSGLEIYAEHPTKPWHKEFFFNSSMKSTRSNNGNN